MSKVKHIIQNTGASEARLGERIQSLWSGYGQIQRVHLEGARMASVIVKEVTPPGGGGTHPRGWATDRSHARKLKSYAVEMAFYQRWAGRCGEGCRIAELHHAEQREDGWLFVLEDLDAAGYPARRGTLDEVGVRGCLRWLAHFHATFLGEQPEGLWQVGSYWHLDTRPDELAVMPEGELKAAAGAIDAHLNAARFQTFVHGDAKVANFCFASAGEAVAAVDFQYIGGGCGMKDVAYFLGSCMGAEECGEREAEHLGFYFDALREALETIESPVDPVALEAEWRTLYPFAWADFERFLLGWSPGHAKLTGYSGRMVKAALAEL